MAWVIGLGSSRSRPWILRDFNPRRHPAHCRRQSGICKRFIIVRSFTSLAYRMAACTHAFLQPRLPRPGRKRIIRDRHCCMARNDCPVPLLIACRSSIRGNSPLPWCDGYSRLPAVKRVEDRPRAPSSSGGEAFLCAKNLTKNNWKKYCRDRKEVRMLYYFGWPSGARERALPAMKNGRFIAVGFAIFPAMIAYIGDRCLTSPGMPGLGKLFVDYLAAAFSNPANSGCGLCGWLRKPDGTDFPP